jgi:hypothetical protein
LVSMNCVGAVVLLALAMASFLRCGTRFETTISP